MHFRDNQLPYHYQVHNFLTKNDFDGLSAFLREHTEILMPDKELTLNPMLHLAGRYGSNQMAVILHEQLGEKAKILARRTVDEGWTPLHLAAVYGDADLMQTLVDILGEEAPTVIAMPLTDNTQATALHLAMSEGKTASVNVLLNACRDKVAAIAALPLADEWTALHLCVHCGDPEMVATLIQIIGKENAWPMAKVYLKSGMNILHLAAISGDADTAALILDLAEDMLYELSQAKVGELDNATPLNLAVQYGLTHMLKKLLVALKELAKPLCQKRMANGWNAFMQIAYFGNVEMLQAMIKVIGQADAEKMIMQPFSQLKDATPFHMVINRGNVAMTKAMIATVNKNNYTALLNVAQTDGVKPIHLAKRFYNDNLLDVLLEIEAEAIAS